jgi:NADH-quinone oxidoreductase subunit A
MLAEYLGVLFILALAVALVCVLAVVSLALRRGRPAVRERDAGASPSGPPGRVPVAFHRRALVAAVAGTYVAFFHPWAATFRDTGLPGLVAIGLFATPLVVGLIYDWAKDPDGG